MPDREPNTREIPRVYASAAGEAFMATLAGLLVGLDDGLIYYATEPLEEMFGYTVSGDLLGKHVEVLVPDTLKDQHVKDREEYSRSPKPRPMGVVSGLVTGRMKDGAIINLAVSLGKDRVISGVRVVPAQVLQLPIPRHNGNGH